MSKRQTRGQGSAPAHSHYPQAHCAVSRRTQPEYQCHTSRHLHGQDSHCPGFTTVCVSACVHTCTLVFLLLALKSLGLNSHVQESVHQRTEGPGHKLHQEGPSCSLLQSHRRINSPEALLWGTLGQKRLLVWAVTVCLKEHWAGWTWQRHCTAHKWSRDAWSQP